MKALTVLAAGLAGLALATPVAAADVGGRWLTPTGATIETYSCGNALCGRIVTSEGLRKNPDMRDTKNSNASLRSRPVKGLVMLSGFTGGPSKWSGGQVYNPQDGRTYSGSVELTAPDKLKLTGCALAIFCKSQEWKRVN
ncbi:MAG: DUF2147 domain-containing protein [Sphingomonas sanxanigenens]|uniref:DUF2147 domain-containing protein n=1 Tax=Sphingomonas sanxanigenens TaxID=397260 RepID=A0A2W5ADA2_9SPHN|nr:MAG: DUF2147 domain-containing protein [Sphingomonas sanxanigenens]